MSLTQRIQALRSIPRSTKAPRPNPHQLVQDDPDSLQAKLATSPYAAILASPMRYCTFHRKHYPSRLLQRFEVGIHPTSRAAIAFPSDDGHGYYIKLHQGVLDHIQQRDHKRLFRGTAQFPAKMHHHLQQQMLQSLIARVPTIELSTTGPHQCLLQLQPPTTTATTLMAYPLYTDPWRPLYDAIVAHHPVAAIGVVKSIHSVPFAVDLFRYHLWVQSKYPLSLD